MTLSSNVELTPIQATWADSWIELPTPTSAPNVDPFPTLHYDLTRLTAMQLAVDLAKSDFSVDILEAANNIYKFITGQTNI